MAVTAEVLEQVRDALAGADGVEHAGIDVQADGDAVVLRGAVPTAEQAETAAAVAAWLTDVVDNRLRVDPHLREDNTDGDAAGGGGGGPARRRPPRGGDLSIQGSGVTPEVVPHDLSGDMHEALAENTPLDPPDTPHGAPSQAEQRGVVDRDTQAERTADPGDVPEDGSKSLPDVSQAELERAARRDPDPDDSVG